MTHCRRLAILTILCLFFNACATYKPQYKSGQTADAFPSKDIAHSFFLLGDAGNYELGESAKVLEAFKTELNNASEESTAIFLGDNIYPIGFPD